MWNRDKMGFIEQNKQLEILPDKGSVLAAMNCREGDLLYESVSDEFDTLFAHIRDSLDVRRSLYLENDLLYVMITAGAGISELSGSLFAKGEGLAGLIVNHAADEVIFKADEQTAEKIKYLCAELGCGIEKRLEAPADIPLSEQAVILGKAGLNGVSVTDGFMFSPDKTMGYILKLTADQATFNAQHDCAKCPNRSCPRRSIDRGRGFQIVSDFDYPISTADGVCIDIGTTTVAAMRFKKGRLCAAHAEVNRQRRFGADVLSRIDAANRGRGAELRAVMEYQLSNCLKAVSGEGEPCVIAANTTMVSLLLGYDCTQLGVYPFKAQNLGCVTQGNRTIIGGISAFVGGDITSGLYMTGFDTSNEVSLFIDLGTNGEMAIGNRERILCTSTAAGPAFEGGRISCGTGSVEGAVCAVDLKEHRLETIGGKPPCGLCGTGIVELMSELKDIGAVDKTGLFSEAYENGYPLTDSIVFTQKDVRELQTAKSAVRAGTEILIREYGCAYEDIKHVYIAGGFGQRLNIEKACNIGLLPPQLNGKYKAVGNSSLGGAAKFLEHDDAVARIDAIRAAAADFPLAENAAFTELFIKYMEF